MPDQHPGPRPPGRQVDHRHGLLRQPEGRDLPPARPALGYGLVGDYKKGQAGLQATHKGVITVDGGRYCPSMPEPLVTATTDFREGRITEEVYRKRVAQRASHRFRPKDGVAHSCPAQGSGATAACPLRPESTGPTIGHRKALTVVLNPPADPPPCCTNRASVSLPHEYDAKYLQALPYGSPQWQRTYRLLRSTMEGYNGFAKDAKNASLAEPGHRRRRGFVNNLLVVAMTIAATNLRKIAAFRRAQAAPPTTGRPSPRRTTPRDPLAVHRPDPNAPPGTMPGAAVA